MVKNISEVGISLGSSVSRTSFSVRNLKNIEHSRLQVTLVNNSLENKLVSSQDSDGDTDAELNILSLNHFCGDVVEDRSEGEGSDLCDLQAIPRKKKNSVKRKKGSKNGPQHKKNIQ